MFGGLTPEMIGGIPALGKIIVDAASSRREVRGQ